MTILTGGTSRIIISNCSFKTFSKWSIFEELSNSDGFGGTGPLGKTYKFGTSVSWILSLKFACFAVKIVVNPWLLETRKERATVGRRRSLSINRTLFPWSAQVTATLELIVDLPSEGSADVKSSVFNCRSAEENWTLVRIVRNCSAIEEVGLVTVINPTPFFILLESNCFFFLNKAIISPSVVILHYASATHRLFLQPAYDVRVDRVVVQQRLAS